MPAPSADPGSELFTENGTNNQNLWAFREVVLLWHLVSTNWGKEKNEMIREIAAGASFDPFPDEDSVSGFTLFCKHLCNHWVRFKLISSTKDSSVLRISGISKAAWLYSVEDIAIINLVRYTHEIPDIREDRLNDVLNKAFRYLLHTTLYLSKPYAFKPAARRVKVEDKDEKPKWEEYMLYFLAHALFFLGYQEGTYACSWKRDAFFVDNDKALQFTADEEHSARKFIEYLNEKALSQKKFTFSCTADPDNGSSFTLTIAPPSKPKKE